MWCGRRPHGIWLNDGPCQNGCRKSNRLRGAPSTGKVYHQFVVRHDRGARSGQARVSGVHSVDASGRVVVAKAIRRNKLLEFFCFAAALPGGARGLRGSAHHWARELIKLGHDARMMPPAWREAVYPPAEERRVGRVGDLRRRLHGPRCDLPACARWRTRRRDAVARRGRCWSRNARGCSTRCAVT